MILIKSDDILLPVYLIMLYTVFVVAVLPEHTVAIGLYFGLFVIHNPIWVHVIQC